MIESHFVILNTIVSIRMKWWVSYQSKLKE